MLLSACFLQINENIKQKLTENVAEQLRCQNMSVPKTKMYPKCIVTGGHFVTFAHI